MIDSSRLERYRAFIDRAPVKRPLLACNVHIYMHRVFPRVCEPLPRGPISPDDVRTDLFLEDCEHLYQLHQEIGDDYPHTGAPFIYLPWMEAIMGCPVVAQKTSTSANPIIEDWNTWCWEKPSLENNPWMQKLLEMMRALVKHSDGRYPLTHTLMRGPADMLSAMRGPTRFPMDFFDNPDAIRRALALCAEVWIEVARAQLDLVPDSTDGYIGSGYFRCWAPGKLIWLQEDAMALLSPKFYHEFVLPQDRRIAAEFPYTAIHLHGSGLWSVDALVETPEIDVIQLNHESALCDVEGTFAAWKKIQHRKPLVIWKEFIDNSFWAWLDRIEEELSPRGLLLSILVDSVENALAVKDRVNAWRAREV